MSRKLLYAVPLLAALILGFALGRGHAGGQAAVARQPLFYVDAMHPSYRSGKPGIAPDCGMQLTPVYAEDLGNGTAGAGDAEDGSLHLSAGMQQMYGISVTPVRAASGQGSLHLFGRVMPDETRLYRVNLGTDGYVKETHGDSIGTRVQKDQHLATVYSPEFLTVAGGYLSANERAPMNGGPARDSNLPPTANAASAQARADRLRNLGMSDAQINELSTTRRIPEDVYVVSPVNGFILARNISPGLRFERHSDLYTIADLSRIWIVAQLPGDDARSLRPGTMATVTLPGTGQSVRARVSSVLPEVDAANHTLSVRLEAANPGLALRPNMFVDVDLPVTGAAGITVPADAVLDTGRGRHVFVQTATGFAAREVQTGWRRDDRVQILSGLHDGEAVAASGTFLLDSESRLQRPSTSIGAQHASMQHAADSPLGAAQP